MEKVVVPPRVEFHAAHDHVLEESAVQLVSKLLSRDLPDVLDWPALDNEIRKERLRSDRTGLPFKVVFFGIPYTADMAAICTALETLVRVIRGTCRQSDTKTIFYDGAAFGMAVILHNVEPQGGERAINAVAEGYGVEATAKSLFCEDLILKAQDYPPPKAEEHGQEAIEAGETVALDPVSPLVHYGLKSPLPVWKRAMDIVGAPS